MKKVFLLFNCALFLMFSASAQPVVKVWDYRYGGEDEEQLSCFQQTSDGGFILGGYSTSGISGDKTMPSQGDRDFYLIKVDSLGRKEWDKTFGGSNRDEMQSLQQTADGGFILAGFSKSGISGDKTQPNWDTAQISSDIWVIKTDASGNKQWDRDLGGAEHEYLGSVIQANDGGYILAGSSRSGISGDKTQTCQGNNSFDYWVVKIDSAGTKLWDSTFGGDSTDMLWSICKSSGGNFLLGGWSVSDSSGDKTQATKGIDDFWIIKIDANGTKIWDKDFGGSSYDLLTSLCAASDGGFILYGETQSGVSGDKTQNLWGSVDCWMVKIDSSGNKLWDRDYGGTNGEGYMGEITETTDHGFLVSAASLSPVSGNKTETNLGIVQEWIIKTDSVGTVLWDKTIFSNPDDLVYSFAIECRDGCFAFADASKSGIAGYKSQPNWDTTYQTADFWIKKFCDSTFIQANLSSTNDLCPGTCTDFSNLSLNAQLYQWYFFGAVPDTSTAINPTNICYASPGSYNVQLIAANAIGSDTLLLNNYINVYPFPSGQSITQNGDTLSAIAGSSSYQWYYNGNIINGATNYFYVATASGNYNVVATDVNGCEAEAVINNVIAGLNQFAPDSYRDGNLQFVIYPNPVTESLYVKSYTINGTAVKISIYNVLGENMTTVLPKENEEEISIDVSTLPEGIYWLEIISCNQSFRRKFVKQ